MRMGSIRCTCSRFLISLLAMVGMTAIPRVQAIHAQGAAVQVAASSKCDRTAARGPTVRGDLCGGVLWERQWRTTSARAELSIAVSSVADHPGGVIAVRSTMGDQVARWTISHPSQTLFLPRGAAVHLVETPTGACHCLFQWTLAGDRGTFHGMHTTRPTTSFRIVGTTRVTAEYVNVSGDISLVPTRPDVVLQPLPASQTRVSPFVALAAAKADWGLTDQQIDPHVGVVRGLISVKNDAVHQNIKAWIIVGDIHTACPAPGCNTVYSTMVIVVDAVTGKTVFSYPADPSPSPLAMGPPPRATPPPPGISAPGNSLTAPTATPVATPTVGTVGPSRGGGPLPTPTPALEP